MGFGCKSETLGYRWLYVQFVAMNFSKKIHCAQGPGWWKCKGGITLSSLALHMPRKGDFTKNPVFFAKIAKNKTKMRSFAYLNVIPPTYIKKI